VRVDAAAVDAHLASCALCPPHFEFERAFLNAVAGARADAEGVGGLRNRVVAALARDGFETP